MAETLQQILDGVRAAQGTEGGGHINAENYSSSGHLINGGTLGTFTRVDFDVAISAETSGSGKAGLRVWGMGAEGEAARTSSIANRVSFSVPVRLPDGDGKRGKLPPSMGATLIPEHGF